MARVFVTGSTDGIGAETGRSLVAAGHRVVLHARSEQRAAVRPGGDSRPSGSRATIRAARG